MIVYEENIDLNKQIQNDIKKLEQFKSSYNKKIDLYNKLLNNSKISLNVESSETIRKYLKSINTQLAKIEKNIELLNCFSNKEKILKNEIMKYNKKFRDINQNFIRNLINGKKLVKDLMKMNNLEIEDNDTLTISENLGKVIFPYTADEILRILKNSEIKTAEEVIDTYFTRPLSDFKFQFISRYKETMKLAIDREKYSFLDALTLATEMMGKRYLHPAIIAACRSLDELDVYLDCLDKGEVDDFKIFKIKYELYPLDIKNGAFSKLKLLFRNKGKDEVDIKQEK